MINTVWRKGDCHMISFDDLRIEEGIPIYLQILLHVKRGIAAGRIRDGDALPSRRVVSAYLGVNPNTVQKAYRMLEEEGLIQSHSGAKSLMVVQEDTVQRVRRELLEQELKKTVDAMKQMGLSREEALEWMETFWE